MPEASCYTEVPPSPSSQSHASRPSLKVLQERAEEPRAGAKPWLLDTVPGTMREARSFSLSPPWSTGPFGMAHFCAVPFLNNSKQCKGAEEKVGGFEQP